MKIVSEWFDAFGPIVVFSIPGSADRVFVKNPETMKTVLSLDGKNPIEPGFDHIVHYRQKLRKDIFHQTAGLIGSHGEPWYDVRSKVNVPKLEMTLKAICINQKHFAGSTRYAET